MSPFLTSLPHQIPFRAASGARFVDEKSAVGSYAVSPADALGQAGAESQFMLFEAMAQVGGSIAFREKHEPAFLSAIDSAEIHERLVVGDAVTLRVTLDATFGRLYRFTGIAEREGVEIARARFYLAAAEENPDA